MALSVYHGFFWLDQGPGPEPPEESEYRDLISHKEISYLREIRAYWNPDDYELYREEKHEQTTTPI